MQSRAIATGKVLTPKSQLIWKQSFFRIFTVNLIATVSDNDMTIFDGDEQSKTTKSRLNALCDAFCVTGEVCISER